MFTFPFILETSTAASAATSLDEISAADSPLEALALAMHTTADNAPDYLWIGNEATQATELGGSGINLLDNGGVTFSEAEPRLGDGNTILFNAGSSQIGVTTASLNMGTGSYAIMHIYVHDTAGTKYTVSKYGYNGFRNYSVNGRRYWNVKSTSGSFTAAVAVDHGITNVQVDLCRRLTSTNQITLDTREGTATAAESTIANADDAAIFSVGKIQSGFSFLGHWGLTAVWVGANAENITAAMRTALQTQLGLD